MKYSMDLFALAEEGRTLFDTVLEKYYESQKDPRILEILGMPQ
ncbi:hypothetical protein ACJJIQ_19550 [Microbulbifer sp. ANSA003]